MYSNSLLPRPVFTAISCCKECLGEAFIKYYRMVTGSGKIMGTGGSAGGALVGLQGVGRSAVGPWVGDRGCVVGVGGRTWGLQIAQSGLGGG